jgi:hypothetical protein
LTRNDHGLDLSFVPLDERQYRIHRWKLHAIFAPVALRDGWDRRVEVWLLERGVEWREQQDPACAYYITALMKGPEAAEFRLLFCC